MPNWCSNYVDIKHTDPTMLADLVVKITKAREAKEPDEGFFNQLKPCPPELLDVNLTTWGGNKEEEEARKAKRSVMVDKYGFESWYDWRVEEWGTKWDIREFLCFEHNNDEVQLQFETAWSPPIPIYELLKEQGFIVNAEYVDEGMGFIGDWRDGDDQCFNGREDLPDRLSHLWPEYDEEGELI